MLDAERDRPGLGESGELATQGRPAGKDAEVGLVHLKHERRCRVRILRRVGAQQGCPQGVARARRQHSSARHREPDRHVVDASRRDRANVVDRSVDAPVDDGEDGGRVQRCTHLVGGEHAERGVDPAQDGCDAEDRAGRERYDGLIVHTQLTAMQGADEIGRCGARQVLGPLDTAPPVALGHVHRGVRASQELFGGLVVLPGEGEADTHGRLDRLRPERDLLTGCLQQPLGELVDGDVVADLLADHQELVAAEAAEGVGRA